MYKGKRLKRKEPRGWNKSKAMLVSLLLVIGVTIGGTLAYIVADSGPVKNTFTPSEVTTYVAETVNGNTKSEVMIKNTGDTTAYIRAAVVITWQDVNGNIYGQAPEAGKNYTAWTPGNGWEQGSDGFYYWTSPVKSDDEDPVNCSTGVLIESIAPVGASPADGYYLTVEIIGSGIQSVPTSVVTEEWSSGVSSVSADGTLTIKQ